MAEDKRSADDYENPDEDEDGASQQNIEDESAKNYELESIKIKASRDRLENRARNSKFFLYYSINS